MHLDANRRETKEAIEKQKQTLIADIEAHAEKMHRKLDELMASHDDLADSMTKQLQTSYYRLEELAEAGQVHVFLQWCFLRPI